MILGQGMLVGGAQSEAECVCDESFYLAEADDSKPECISCDEEKTTCDRPGVELLTLPLAIGYWRVTGTSTSLLECPTADACIGGSMCNASATSAATCDARADNLCAASHRGPLCQVCVEGHYKPSRGSLCMPCGGASSVASYSTAGGLAALLIATPLACLYTRRLRRRRRAKKHTKKSTEEKKSIGQRVRQAIWRRLQSESLKTKIKLVISLFQVAGSFDMNFDGNTSEFNRHT
jgi:hypothetical protein